MAKKLVRVDRGGHPEVFIADGIRHEPEAISGRQLDHANGVGYQKQVDFFTIDERSIDPFVEWMAKENPGCEIQVYGLEKVGVCPAGDFILKRATVDGILPT